MKHRETLLSISLALVLFAAPLVTEAQQPGKAPRIGYLVQSSGSAEPPTPARPGGNVTGLTTLSPASSGKRLQLIMEVVPKVTHVGVLWGGGGNPVMDREWEETHAAAQPLNVQLCSIVVRDPAEFPGAFAEAARQQIQAVLMFNVPAWSPPAAVTQIAEMALQNRLTIPQSVLIQADRVIE
jgi:putative ABC transport system substrate-binding protein